MARSDFRGIYDVPEAARYLKAVPYGSVIYAASSTKLLSWIRRGVASRDLVHVHGLEMLIAFEDLISMRVIASLRAAGVSWVEIDLTREWLRDVLGAECPFATEYMWTGQGQIFVDWTERLISASRHGQMALEMLKEYLIPIHGLQFDNDTRVATSWEPVHGVVLQPRVQFGAPCIKGTRIPTRTISWMVKAGDSVDWIAAAYDISSDDVNAACDWETRLQAA